MIIAEARTGSMRMTLRTERQCSATDLSDLMVAMDRVYGAFFSRQFPAAPTPTGLSQRAFDQLVLTYGSALTARERRTVEGIRAGKSLKEIAESLSIKVKDVYELLNGLNLRVEPFVVNSLQVNSIRIGSPGFISFEGLGEVVREVREFVKDLWYRNRHERMEAELRLNLLASYVIDDQHLTSALLALDTLQELEDQGKLANPGETIEDEDPFM